MASQLAEARTAEEQTRELADAISELAQKEQTLAAKTPKLDQRNHQQAQQGQQDVASRLDVLKERVAKLSATAAPETNLALERAQRVADSLADPTFANDAIRRLPQCRKASLLYPLATRRRRLGAP